MSGLETTFIKSGPWGINQPEWNLDNNLEYAYQLSSARHLSEWFLSRHVAAVRIVLDEL